MRLTPLTRSRFALKDTTVSRVLTRLPSVQLVFTALRVLTYLSLALMATTVTRRVCTKQLALAHAQPVTTVHTRILGAAGLGSRVDLQLLKISVLTGTTLVLSTAQLALLLLLRMTAQQVTTACKEQ